MALAVSTMSGQARQAEVGQNPSFAPRDELLDTGHWRVRLFAVLAFDSELAPAMEAAGVVDKATVEGTKVAKTQLDGVRLYSDQIVGHCSENLLRDQWLGLQATCNTLPV